MFMLSTTDSERAPDGIRIASYYIARLMGYIGIIGSVRRGTHAFQSGQGIRNRRGGLAVARKTPSATGA